mmetsp:Transcript_88660/g.264486  ORF Transcript_88660/g.264486 Transcript_88660/m.264486 type:complete len:211 (-) Transcript_88660:404-1036(-)
MLTSLSHMPRSAATPRPSWRWRIALRIGHCTALAWTTSSGLGTCRRCRRTTPTALTSQRYSAACVPGCWWATETAFGASSSTRTSRAWPAPARTAPSASGPRSRSALGRGPPQWRPPSLWAHLAPLQPRSERGRWTCRRARPGCPAMQRGFWGVTPPRASPSSIRGGGRRSSTCFRARSHPLRLSPSAPPRRRRLKQRPLPLRVAMGSCS